MRFFAIRIDHTNVPAAVSNMIAIAIIGVMPGDAETALVIKPVAEAVYGKYESTCTKMFCGSAITNENAYSGTIGRMTNAELAELAELALAAALPTKVSAEASKITPANKRPSEVNVRLVKPTMFSRAGRSSRSAKVWYEITTVIAYSEICISTRVLTLANLATCHVVAEVFESNCSPTRFSFISVDEFKTRLVIDTMINKNKPRNTPT